MRREEGRREDGEKEGAPSEAKNDDSRRSDMRQLCIMKRRELLDARSSSIATA